LIIVDGLGRIGGLLTGGAGKMGTSDITVPTQPPCGGSGPASGRTSPTPISTLPPWPRRPRRQERQRCWKLVSGQFNRAEVVRDDEASAPLWPGSPASRKRIRRSVNAVFLRIRSDFFLQLTTSVIPSSAYIRMTILTTLPPFFSESIIVRLRSAT